MISIFVTFFSISTIFILFNVLPYLTWTLLLCVYSQFYSKWYCISYFFLHQVSLPRYILIICIHDTLCNVTCVVLVTTHFFISNAFFYLTFSLTELQMLLSCRLINISIIIVRHFLYLLYLCPCIDSGQFISYLCDLFFIFIFICIMINRLISWIQTHCFAYYLKYALLFLDDNVDEDVNNFQIVKVQPHGNASHLLDFCQFQPGIAYKSVSHKKACITLEFAA